MEHRTVKKKYQDWSEDRLAAEERHDVQKHIDGCDECRAYYDKMFLLVEKTDPAFLPHLTPDPYLATRIRALAGGRRPVADRRRALGWLRLSAAGAALVAAAMAGVFLGRGIGAAENAAGTAEAADIAEAYYEAFSPSDFSGVWETVINNTDSNGSNEANR